MTVSNVTIKRHHHRSEAPPPPVWSFKRILVVAATAFALVSASFAGHSSPIPEVVPATRSRSFAPLADRSTPARKSPHLHKKTSAITRTSPRLTSVGSCLADSRPYERAAAESCPDSLQLQRFSPKPIALKFGAIADHNGALDPKLSTHLDSALSLDYSYKYVQIDSFEEMCAEIASAAKLGNVTAVIINAHGDPWRMQINDQPSDVSLTKLNDWRHCFAPLDPTARVLLMSCNTANEEFEEFGECIASHIAKETGLRVIAPVDLVESENIRIHRIVPLQVSMKSSFGDCSICQDISTSDPKAQAGCHNTANPLTS